MLKIKKSLFLIVVCFLSSFLASASDCVRAVDEGCAVITKLSRPLTIVPTTNGFGRSCDGFIDLKDSIDTQLRLLPMDQPIATYEMGPGQGFMLAHLLAQQTAGHYGAFGLRYTYSELSRDACESVEKVFADSSTNTSNSCVATEEPDALAALRSRDIADSFNLFTGSNTVHFLSPSKFLDSLRGANCVLKNGGILALSLNCASSIKDEEFRRTFTQARDRGDYWPGYGTTERETLRHIRTERFFEGDWKSAVESSETFKVLDLLPAGIQSDVLGVIESHSKQLQGREVVLNIHDQRSITKLLEFCGFEVLSCNVYSEIYKSNFENSYMGVIARKQYNPNYVSLIPASEGEAKEKIVTEMISRASTDLSDIIYLEIRNALQILVRHPTEGRYYSSAEVDDMLQRGVTCLRKKASKA